MPVSGNSHEQRCEFLARTATQCKPLSSFENVSFLARSQIRLSVPVLDERSLWWAMSSQEQQREGGHRVMARSMWFARRHRLGAEFASRHSQPAMR